VQYTFIALADRVCRVCRSLPTGRQVSRAFCGCPSENKGCGRILPTCNTEAIGKISAIVAARRHAAVLVDQPAWHLSEHLILPDNITIRPLDRMHDTWLSDHVFTCYDNLVVVSLGSQQLAKSLRVRLPRPAASGDAKQIARSPLPLSHRSAHPVQTSGQNLSHRDTPAAAELGTAAMRPGCLGGGRGWVQVDRLAHAANS
jgi:hypothetical protein